MISFKAKKLVVKKRRSQTEEEKKKEKEMKKAGGVHAAGRGKAPFIVGPVSKDDDDEEKTAMDVEPVKKSLDPALAARQNMKPMSTLGAMGDSCFRTGQVFIILTIGANFC